MKLPEGFPQRSPPTLMLHCFPQKDLPDTPVSLEIRTAKMGVPVPESSTLLFSYCLHQIQINNKRKRVLFNDLQATRWILGHSW